jgi:hypothetical protein
VQDANLDGVGGVGAGRHGADGGDGGGENSGLDEGTTVLHRGLLAWLAGFHAVQQWSAGYGARPFAEYVRIA